MTNSEAIQAIKHNWPHEKYTMLIEALELAIDALFRLEGLEK